MSVTWVRTGVVFETEHGVTLETEHKNGVESEIGIAWETSGASHDLAETSAIHRLDANRVFFQLAWQPNQNYQFYLNDNETTATSPLKPEPYLIRTVELDELLSLMENLRQPRETHSTRLRTRRYPAISNCNR